MKTENNYTISSSTLRGKEKNITWVLTQVEETNNFNSKNKDLYLRREQ